MSIQSFSFHDRIVLTVGEIDWTVPYEKSPHRSYDIKNELHDLLLAKECAQNMTVALLNIRHKDFAIRKLCQDKVKYRYPDNIHVHF